MRVGIAGFGNIGQELVRRLAGGAIPDVTIAGLTARDLEKLRERAGNIPVLPLSALVDACDVVVECATASAFPEIARATVRAGKHLICVSAGGFLDAPDIIELARRHGGRIQIATGALPGLDVLRCAAEGTIHRVHLHSVIRPESVKGEKYVADQGFDFANRPPVVPTRIFAGTAQEAVSKFPRHLNIAVALSVAGIGLERTTLELWVDATISGATNTVTIEADDISASLTAQNIPSPANPKTSRIVAPSIVAALRGLKNVLLAGS